MQIKNAYIQEIYVPSFVKEGAHCILHDSKKRPMNVHTLKLDDATKPESCASYDEAWETFQNNQGKVAGVGYSLDEKLNIVCIDIDHCILTDGTYSDVAKDIIAHIKNDTYIEISRSGSGLHIFIRGKKNSARARCNDVEMYSEKRYIAMTFNAISATDASENQDLIDYIESKYFLIESNHNKISSNKNREISSADELIAVCENDKKKGKLFSKLYSGDYSDYKSQSEAELAFFDILAFHTVDVELLINVYKKSSLYRLKGEREDYLLRTINKAIESSSQHININKNIDIDILNRINEIDPINNEKYSELDNIKCARLFSEIIKKEHRFFADEKAWYYYDGTRWIIDTAEMKIKSKIKLFSEAMQYYLTIIADAENDKNRKKFFSDKAKWFTDTKVRDNLINDSCDLVCFFEKDICKNTNLLNCKNGVINLQTMEFMEHDPELLLTKITNVAYDKDAACPTFKKFIFEIMSGDEEKVRYLQHILGHGLSGNVYKEELYIFYGETTRNGKSTLLETIVSLLGDYAASINPETLAARDRDSRKASSDLARLKEIRFVQASEPPRKMTFDVALLKKITGRDTITARSLYKTENEYKPEFKVYMNTNYLPIVGDKTLFNSGRVKVITFDVHFDEEHQDRSLKDRLLDEKELSGILNWLLAGLEDFIKNPLWVAPSVSDATENYQHDSDKISLFMDDCCLKDDSSNIKGADLYEAYKNWCTDTQVRAESKNNFLAELKTRGLIAARKSVNNIDYRNIMTGYKLIDNNKVYDSDGFTRSFNPKDIPF